MAEKNPVRGATNEMPEKRPVRITQEQLMQAFFAENSRLEETNRRINAAFGALQEVATAIASLEALETAKENEKMLVPLGAGVFLHSGVHDGKNVLFSLAGGVMKTQKSADARKELEKRKRELESLLDRMRRDQFRIAENANAMSAAIRQGQAQARQKQTG